MYDPPTAAWKEWKLPGGRPQAYAVYVDDRDHVRLTDFGGNAIVRFDRATEQFPPFFLAGMGASVRQLLGRRGIRGTTSTIVVTVVKANQSSRTSFSLVVTDVAEKTRTCR